MGGGRGEGAGGRGEGEEAQNAHPDPPTLLGSLRSLFPPILFTPGIMSDVLGNHYLYKHHSKKILLKKGRDSEALIPMVVV